MFNLGFCSFFCCSPSLCTTDFHMLISFSFLLSYDAIPKIIFSTFFGEWFFSDIFERKSITFLSFFRNTKKFCSRISFYEFMDYFWVRRNVHESHQRLSLARFPFLRCFKSFFPSASVQIAQLNALANCLVFNYFHIFFFYHKKHKASADRARICFIDIYAYTNNLHQLIMNQRDSYEKNPSSVDT